MLNHKCIFGFIFFDSDLKFGFECSDKVFESFDLILFILNKNGVFKLTLIDLWGSFKLLDFDLIMKRVNLSSICCIEIFDSVDFLIFFFKLIFIFFNLNKLLFKRLIKRKCLILSCFRAWDLILQFLLQQFTLCSVILKLIFINFVQLLQLIILFQ